MPKVSVIVPVYNVADYLPQCLDSILLQTFTDFEVIAIDDGSTDNSLEILQTYAMLDERMKVSTQKNAGVGATRNRAIKQATGEYIICLDSDDFFEADMLEKMVAKAEQDGSDVVVAGHFIFDNNTKQTVEEIKIDEKYLKMSPFKPEDLGKELLLVCNMGPWTKLVRSDLVKQNNLEFDEKAKYGEDILYGSFSLLCAKKISALPMAFVHYRINQTNNIFGISANRQNHFADCLCVFKKLIERLNSVPPEKRNENALILFMNSTMRWILGACPSDKRRENLLLIREHLPKELYEKLFFYQETKVSIIIPVYNCAEFLPECLDSCINQTLKEIEIICVDDGSTDNSLEILQQYAKKDSRITVLQQENSRQAIARNLAMPVATGKYVQFLDADDYMEKDACECFYLYSEIFALQMCQCTSVEFYNHNRKEFENPYHCLTWLQDNMPPVFNKWMFPDILPHMAVTAWLTFYRRDFLIRNNISWINKKIAYEDTPFFVESLLKATRIGAFKAPLYHRRVHSAATTQQMANNFNEYMWILKYTLDMTKKLAEPDVHIFYCYTFLEKAYMNFAALDPTDKLQMAPYLFDFCWYILEKQHLPLIANVQDWCLRYLNSLPKKVRLKFKFYTLLAKCIRRQYAINLLSVQLRPAFYLKIFGLPVVSTVIQFEKRTKTEEKTDTFHQNIFVKFCGFTVLKIKETQNV